MEFPYYEFGMEEEGFLLATQKEMVKPHKWGLTGRLQEQLGMKQKSQQF